jgi:hypothetical protein
MGDQLWPLLADAYSLKASSVLTLEEAKGFVAALGWEEHTLTSDDKDENQSVQRLLAYVVRMARPEGPTDRTPGELILVAAGAKTPIT